MISEDTEWAQVSTLIGVSGELRDDILNKLSNTQELCRHLFFDDSSYFRFTVDVYSILSVVTLMTTAAIFDKSFVVVNF